MGNWTKLCWWVEADGMIFWQKNAVLQVLMWFQAENFQPKFHMHYSPSYLPDIAVPEPQKVKENFNAESYLKPFVFYLFIDN